MSEKTENAVTPDKWRSMVLDCEQYLKEGETPAQRIKREIEDCLSLMKLLEKEKLKSESLEAENAKFKEAVSEVVRLLWDSMSRQESVGPHGGYIYMKLRPTLAELTGGKDE